MWKCGNMEMWKLEDSKLARALLLARVSLLLALLARVSKRVRMSFASPDANKDDYNNLADFRNNSEYKTSYMH